MVRNITLTVFPGEETDSALVRSLTAEAFHCDSSEITHIAITKKSIDARHGRQKIHLQLTVYVNEVPPETDDSSPTRWLPLRNTSKSVVIVGCGPAGLFAAFRLLESGVKPVIIERGKRTSERKRDIAAIGHGGDVNENSNYCFGEGGAGTFSDGKLYTRSNKRGSIRKVLETLRYFGADEAILTDAHPHIGSDRLPAIISAMTDKIRELGGEVHFETLCEDFILESDAGGGTSSEDPRRNKILRGIRVKNLTSGENAEVKCNALILATGHSATGIYRLLAEIAPDALEAKTFAAGVRLEHPREIIDAIQYHGANSGLPAAEYRLTTQIDGRGVYSFCMCPGGLIVPAASAPGEIVINGMSPSGRNSRWSNAAFVVELRPEDVVNSENVANRFSGLNFRESIEKTAFVQAHTGHASLAPQAAPAQLLIDFLVGRESKNLPESSYTPGIVPSRLDLWLPEHIARRLKKAFPEFEKKMRGFICPEALLIAPETRTSTPLRIKRNTDLESAAISGLFPAGEGSGYAGGIVSSAIDGENAASAVITRLG
jgi:uncharacterized FAD-dependent dehydrogenase